MIDLTEQTFIPELVSRCWLNGNELEYGCVHEKRMQGGRPGVSGYYRPQLREGAGDHSTIYIRSCDGGILEFPKVTDTVEVLDDDSCTVRIYDVRGIDGTTGGAISLLCSERGSRLVNARRKAGNNVTGVRN